MEKTTTLFVALALVLGVLFHQGQPARITPRTRVASMGSRTRRTDDTVHEAIVPLRNEPQVTMILKLYDNKTSIINACLKAGAWPGWDAAQVAKAHPAPGCTMFNLETKVCTINVLKPTSVDDADRMENLGHETLHCFYGAYHSQE